MNKTSTPEMKAALTAMLNTPIIQAARETFKQQVDAHRQALKNKVAVVRPKKKKDR